MDTTSEQDAAANRYQAVVAEIEKASQKIGSEPPRLLAVSKTKSATAIRALAELGQYEFGENYLQEAILKQQQLQQHYPNYNIVWHFIGHVQSNKTQIIAEHFDWVQTVDRVKIARRLHEQRPVELEPINICIQINISGEASKSGISAADLWPLVEEIQAFEKVKLRGLMAIPAPDNSVDKQQLKADFAEMASLYKALQQKVTGIDTLSIGMSSDLALAVEYGSTMVRVGTALFGAREYKAKESG